MRRPPRDRIEKIAALYTNLNIKLKGYTFTMGEVISFQQARFMQSAQTVPQCPEDSGVEVAFAGRSNAGKSSAINTLTRQSGLARTSKTPGRTQLINFFALTEHCRLVDLPGYGFAKVPKAMKVAWDRNLADYLQRRRSLQGLVLLMDVRHPLQPYDEQMVLWAVEAGMPVHILLTKSDKLKRGAALNVLHGVCRQLEVATQSADLSVQLFSSHSRQGLEELEQQLKSWYERGAEL